MIPGPSSLAEVIASLDQPRPTFSEAMTSVADAPGSCALHDEASTWRDLGLGEPPDGRPLYVGKAERLEDEVHSFGVQVDVGCTPGGV